MTAGPRGTRSRRGGQRLGWVLLSSLLGLAIIASSLLVFTNRVELLKLAVIVALWAAVMAAFASMTYRRASDADRARARDLKYVYDLQLDREISARREYESTLEAQLRHELSGELRVTWENEVAALRSELSSLRAQLEILFGADLGHHRALESERTTVRAYSDWAHADGPDAADHAVGEPGATHAFAGTSETPIIDVSEVRLPTGGLPVVDTHRPQAGQQRQPGRHAHEQRPAWRTDEAWRTPPYGEPIQASETTQPQQPVAQPQLARSSPDGQGTTRSSGARRRARPAAEPVPEPQHSRAAGWQPAPAEGQWLPPGIPGSSWAAGPAADEAPEHARHGRSSEETAPDEADRSGRHTETTGRNAGSSAAARVAQHRRGGEQPAAAPLAAAEAGTDAAPGFDEPGTGRRAIRADTADAYTVDQLMARLQPEMGGGRRRRRSAE